MRKDRNRLWNFLFVLSIAGLALYYSYHEIVFYPPQSIHAWRQTDCASITLNYYQHGMRFFKPEIHNLITDGGKAGYAATSEIPLLYYATAWLYHVFGPHDFLIRLLNMLFFFTGLYFLYRLFLLVLEDIFWAWTLTLLVFTSPVLVYYANNYLTDIPAFSFAIIACYHFFRYQHNGKNRHICLSALFMFMAGSMKLTGLFALVAILLIFAMDQFRSGSLFHARPAVFKFGDRKVIPFLVILLPVAGWVIYAAVYNRQHLTTYFSTTIFPIWDFDIEGIRHIHRPLLYLSLLLIPVLLLYVILQFYVFANHDYYTVNMFILPVFILAASMQGMSRRVPRIAGSPVVKTVFLMFLLWNVHYAGERLGLRYTGWRNETAALLGFRDVRDHLPAMGIEPADTVVAITGRSQQALYFMNLKGWTDYFGEETWKGRSISLNRDSTGIQASIDKGAAFLFITGIEEFRDKPWLMPYSKHLAGRVGEILVFDLRSGIENFNVLEPAILWEISCDAEALSENGEYYLTSVDSVRLESGNTRTAEQARSGMYSARLGSGREFAMAVSIPGVEHGQYYEVSVWMMDPDDQCRIIASGPDPEVFYHTIQAGSQAAEQDWHEKVLPIPVPGEMDNKTMTVYLYHTGGDPVYCDDLVIRRYDHRPLRFD